MDALSIKLAVLNSAPPFVRRLVMTRRFRDEVERTGEAEMLHLGDFLSPGDLALDIGANLGGYTYEMARLCGCVIAFEPNPTIARALAGLALSGVEVRRMCVGASTTTADLHVPHGQRHVLASLRSDVVSGQDATTVPVKVVALDDLDLPKVRFIKIDVEGAEEDVLAGGMGLIERDRPTLLIEIEERHNPGALDRITRRLTEIGYHGSFLRDDWQDIASFTPDLQDARHLLPGAYPTRRAIPYVNNFLFRPRDRQS